MMPASRHRCLPSRERAMPGHGAGTCALKTILLCVPRRAAAPVEVLLGAIGRQATRSCRGEMSGGRYPGSARTLAKRTLVNLCEGQVVETPIVRAAGQWKDTLDLGWKTLRRAASCPSGLPPMNIPRRWPGRVYSRRFVRSRACRNSCPAISVRPTCS